VSYYSSGEPIKVGYLMDILVPDGFPADIREDLIRPIELVFGEGLKQGLIDRPVEIVRRDVEGLPKGTVRAVIEAYGELVDAGCLAVIGPSIADNCIPTRKEIERRFRVPSVSMTGSDDWLGKWTFALPMGSHTDEPMFWAHLLSKGGHTEVGALVEQSLVGELYAENFERACRVEGLRLVARETIPQIAMDISDAVGKLYEAKVTGIVHCGFGFGIVNVNPALEALTWDPPRYLSTAFENAWISREIWQAMLGWVGVDQYDEGNPVGQSFLDLYEATYGRRPEYCFPLQARDLATVVLHALSDAQPLSPLGVKNALERVKMLPAGCGSAGTRLSFGKWTRRGWMGSGYLVARELDPDGINSHLWKTRLVARFGQD